MLSRGAAKDVLGPSVERRLDRNQWRRLFQEAITMNRLHLTLLCVLRRRFRPWVWDPRLPVGVRVPVRAERAGRALSTADLAQPSSHSARPAAAGQQLLRSAEPR